MSSAEPQVMDLLHETLTTNADISLQVDVRPLQDIGHAVLFVGAAQRYAAGTTINVERIAGALLTDGVPERKLGSLAILVHDHEELPQLQGPWSVGGWHSAHNDIYFEVGDRVAYFPHALHLVLPRKNPDNTLWHEAGHLKNFLTHTQGKVLYTPDNMAKLSQVAGNITGGAGPIIIKKVLWNLSSEEWRAGRYARAHKDHKIVIGATGRNPSNHFVVQIEQLRTTERVQVDEQTGGHISLVVPFALPKELEF